MRVAVGFALCLAATGSACAREARPSGFAWIGSVGPEAVEGRVRVVGSAPFSQAVVEPDAGEGMVVTGPYRSEIQRLSGAHVRITGHYEKGQLSETVLEATSYEILSVDGDRPLIGRLEEDDGGFFLAGTAGEMRRVGVISESLQTHVGSIVWVVLDEYDGVARYGILRAPVS